MLSPAPIERRRSSHASRLPCFVVDGHDGKTDDEIRGELGEKFPKHIYHSIICIGALIAHQETDHIARAVTRSFHSP